MSSIKGTPESTGLVDLAGSRIDQACESVNGLVNCMMAFFWKGEQNVQYCFLAHLPGFFGQETSKTKEYAKRICLGIPNFFITLAGGFFLMPVAMGLTGLTALFHGRDYRYLSGLAPERSELTSKALHLNCCMLPGGLPYLFGGMATAGERLEALANLIKTESPDLIFLCEFSRTMGGRLYKELRGDYAHFFLDIGLSAKGLECSYFIACRDKILIPPVFIPSSVAERGDHKGIKRGYFLVETERACYIYTHLHAKNTELARATRQKQLDEIVTTIKTRTEDKPCLLIGDLNIDRIRQRGDYEQMLGKGFIDACGDQPSKTTCTNAFDWKVNGRGKGLEQETLDYVLTYQKEKPIQVEVALVDTWKVKLSDHKGVVATITTG